MDGSDLVGLLVMVLEVVLVVAVCLRCDKDFRKQTREYLHSLTESKQFKKRQVYHEELQMYRKAEATDVFLVLCSILHEIAPQVDPTCVVDDKEIKIGGSSYGFKIVPTAITDWSIVVNRLRSNLTLMFPACKSIRVSVTGDFLIISWKYK